MKVSLKFNLMIAAVAILLASCSTPKNAPTSSLSASGWKSRAIGNWVLNSVDFEGFPAGAKVKSVFGEASYQCFIGSQWKLPYNGFGSYTLTSNDGGCPSGQSQNIVWSVFDGGNGAYMFQFKKLIQGVKAKNVEEGYRLALADATETSMTLKAPVDVSGSTAYIVYKFTKQPK